MDTEDGLTIFKNYICGSTAIPLALLVSDKF